jgi:hypothetical protein
VPRWFMLSLLVVALVLPLAVLACGGELPPQSRVDKLRLLAVRAEPPDVRPGQTAVLDALAVLPPPDVPDGGTASQVSYLWLACLQISGALAPSPCGTATDNALPDGGTAMVPLCADSPASPLCLIGLTPEVRYAPPASALDGEVILTLFVADAEVGGAIGCAMSAASNGGAPPDPDHCVIGLKRLTVSNSADPNRNPTLESFTIGGNVSLTSDSLTDGSARFNIVPNPAVNSTDFARLLQVVRTPGSSQVKVGGNVEALYVSYFVSAGAMRRSRSTFQPAECDDACKLRELPPTTGSSWEPPSEMVNTQYIHDGLVYFWAVVHDERGGVGWLAGSARQQQ